MLAFAVKIYPEMYCLTLMFFISMPIRFVGSIFLPFHKTEEPARGYERLEPDLALRFLESFYSYEEDTFPFNLVDITSPVISSMFSPHTITLERRAPPSPRTTTYHGLQAAMIYEKQKHVNAKRNMDNAASAYTAATRKASDAYSRVDTGRSHLLTGSASDPFLIYMQATNGKSKEGCKWSNAKEEMQRTGQNLEKVGMLNKEMRMRMMTHFGPLPNPDATVRRVS